MKRLPLLFVLALLTGCQAPMESDEKFSCKVSLDETLLPSYDVQFPLVIKELPKAKPLKSGVSFSNPSLSELVAYHGEYHGFDVYSAIGESGWGAPFDIALGNFVFHGANPYKIYVHEAEDTYSIPLTHTGTGAIAYDNVEISPIIDFYCDGTFTDEEMLEIYLERIDYYGEKANQPYKKTDAGYVIGDDVSSVETNYHKGFPFQGQTLSYREMDFQVPEALKVDLSKEKKRTFVSLRPAMAPFSNEPEVICQILDGPGEECIFLGEMEGYSFYVPKKSKGACLDSPFTYHGLRRALYTNITDCKQIYGYKDGTSFSLSYLYQSGDVSKATLWDIGNALYCFSAKDVPAENREQYGADYYQKWQTFYRAGGNGFFA